MSPVDWLVLVGAIVGIAAYGAWRGRGVDTARGFFRGENLRWPTIGLSIIATQASAITFLSVPGQAYEDGMRFIQFYFGLPIAMVIVAAVFVPIYHQLGVFTAYAYLEQRFDVRVRVLAATLFLVGRGLAAGISIYAPAILLSTVMGWSLGGLNAVLGGVVVVYVVSGGASAVAQTQKQQMVVILAGIFTAAAITYARLPDGVGLHTAATLAGALGRMNVVAFSLDPSSRYTVWSGLTGGLFLSLSYFGTDQSQVQRYLGGASVAESRLGLLFNGIVKIPMQFVILFIGILVFTTYLFERPPVLFDRATLEQVRVSDHAAALAGLEARWDDAFAERRAQALALVEADTPATRGALVAANTEMEAIHAEAVEVAHAAVPASAGVKDSDFVFVSFVLASMPRGVVGLLMAVIFLASMSTTASELSSLGATSVVDLYERLVLGREAEERARLVAGKVLTVAWGLFAIGFATFASLVDNLIQAVNILGSIFYGVILGIFLTGFFVRRVGSTAVLVAAVAAEGVVIGLYATTDIGFLWFNVIGCAGVVGLGVVVEAVLRLARPQSSSEGG